MHSFCFFVFVSSMGGSTKATECSSNGLLFIVHSIFFLYFLVPLFPSPPALCWYLLPLLPDVLPVKSIILFALLCPCNNNKRQQSSPFCFAHATGICSSSGRGVFFWHLQPFLSFAIFLHHLQNTYLSFALLCFLNSILSFLSSFPCLGLTFPFFPFIYGLACHVIFPYPVR